MLLAELCLTGSACCALTPTQPGSSRAKEQLPELREWCQDAALEWGKGKEKSMESQHGWGWKGPWAQTVCDQ